MDVKILLLKIFLYGYFLFGYPISIMYGQVVINEVCTSPAAGVYGSAINANSLYNTSPDEQPPYNREWIELYNPHPCNSVDISCYTIAGNMLQHTDYGDVPNWGAFTFPAGTVIPPLGFIIIGGNNADVPFLDFNLTYYRQAYYGVQYLDGDETRWFLRDEYGWVALYSPNGTVVDAVYWDVYGNPANLYTQLEYQQNVVTRTSCYGWKTLAAARNIAGIEYLGACSPGTNLSFQRIFDGSDIWYSGPVSPTPRACNGPCVTAPQLSFTVQNESCVGNDGSITLTIQDGHIGPYTINWIHPQGLHSATISNLSAGTYIVQVVDAYQCFTVYDTIIVTRLPDPTVDLSNFTNETCSMSNGAVTANVTNATAPVNYLWSTVPSQNTATIQNLPAGTYSVTITDAMGCTASNTVTLINFPGPQIHIDSIVNELCSESNGAIYTTTTGGNPPFNFTWNLTSQNTEDISGIHAGNYIVTVTDVFGCTATATAQVTNTPPPTVHFDYILPDTCHKQTGAVSVSVSGGNPPYTYHWSVSDSIHVHYVSGLYEGNYTLTVTDSLCSVVVNFHIPNLPGPKADFRFYPPVTTIDNPTFRFEDWSLGVINSWLWNFGDGTTSTLKNPFHTYNDIGFYKVILKVSNVFGCNDTISKTAVVIDKITLYIPNCFTPNGDGINDFFFVLGQNICDFDFNLYNRWGELIYHSGDINEKWDGVYKGKIIPEGVYNYIVNYSEDWAGIRRIPKSMKGMLIVVK